MRVRIIISAVMVSSFLLMSLVQRDPRWLVFLLLIILVQLQEDRMHRLVRQMDLGCPQPLNPLLRFSRLIRWRPRLPSRPSRPR